MRLEFEPNVAAIPLVENEVFEHLGHREEHDLDSLLKKGISAAQCGDRSLARRLLTEAAEVDPASETAWMWLASISEYPEELLAFLNRVLDINPANEKAAEWRRATNALLAKTFVQRAIAAREDGAFDLAEQSLAQALAHDANCIAAWLKQAEWADDEALRTAAYKSVLTIDPENVEARAALDEFDRQRSNAAFSDAKAAAVAGKRKKALELVDEFLRTVPDNAEAWVLRSNLAIDINDKIQSLEEALKIDEYNLTARAMYDFLTTTLRPEPVVEHIETVEPPKEPQKDVLKIEAVPEEHESPASEAAEHGESHRSVEELFGGGHEADPDGLTAESVQLPTDVIDSTVDAKVGDDPFAETVAALAVEGFKAEDPAGQMPNPGLPCPFCRAENAQQAFECETCKALLSYTDLDALLSDPKAEHDVVQQAVTEMEGEWNLREFSVEELRVLGLGHFNLGDHDAGLKYLHEASRLEPNDVILAGEVNAIAIRLDEMQRQVELHGSMPGGRTILVVDDSPTVRKLIAGKLEKCGHTVICAADGVEALDQLEAGLPDLVLLDIAMPRMDGYEVCKQIRANPEARDLPVVMISGKDGFFDKVRGRMAGTTGYVTKPFGPETLMKALETYLAPANEQTPAS
ncbi:MAG: response regulator [Chloracidobacterium sp.]|nr:response regulator [Chloracidobacterium sp.]